MFDSNDNQSSDDLDVQSVGSSPNGFKTSQTSTDASSPPSMLSSVHGSSPTLNGGSPTSATSMSSVQSALAALKAGQMSLNQVKASSKTIRPESLWHRLLLFWQSS